MNPRDAEKHTKGLFRLFFVSFVPLGLFILFFLLACSSHKAPPKSSTTPPKSSPVKSPSPSVRVTSQSPVEIIQEDEGGRPLWRLKFKKAVGQVIDGEGSGELHEVQGILYREGKPALEIRAQRARADTTSGRVIAWGKVQAKSQVNEAKLEADKIVWESKRNLLTAEGNVRLQWKQLEISDHRIQADTILKRVWGGS